MQTRFAYLAPSVVFATFCASFALPAAAQTASAQLTGLQEVPALYTTASGSFSAHSTTEGIAWELSYSGVASGVTQAHIHIGQKGVNGGISVFLCSNLDDPSAGTQACPAGNATISGLITAASVLGPTSQGVTAGNLDAFLAMVADGAAYANVHSVTFPGGEIRGQLRVSGSAR